MRRDLLVPALVLTASLACNPSKSSSGGNPAAPPATSTSAAASPSASSAPTAGAATVEAWSGTYVSAPGALYVFDGGEWASVQWRGDDAGLGLGEGTIHLTIDRKTGLAQGEIGGAVGDAVLSGTATDDTITASVLRKDPRDRGLTGTAVLKISGDKLAGSMRLSVANARVIREATLTLARDPR